jgi:hypothetical protein
VHVTVNIKHGDLEETFSGDADAVWKSVNRFFSQLVPLLDTIQGVVLRVDVQQAVKASENMVAVGKEGPVVLVNKAKLTDSETLLLMLLAAWIGDRLGLLAEASLSKEALRGWLGKSGKITGTRLGELSREGLVVKTQEGHYQLSSLGVKRLVEETLPQIKERL